MINPPSKIIVDATYALKNLDSDVEAHEGYMLKSLVFREKEGMGWYVHISEPMLSSYKGCLELVFFSRKKPVV